jgi:hypothetical protein
VEEGGVKIVVRRMDDVFVAYREDGRVLRITGMGRSEAEAIGELIVSIAQQSPHEWPGLEVIRK